MTEDEATAIAQDLAGAVRSPQRARVRQAFTALACLDGYRIARLARRVLEETDLPALAGADATAGERAHRAVMDVFYGSLHDYLRTHAEGVDQSVEHDVPSWIEANAPALMSANLRRMEAALPHDEPERCRTLRIPDDNRDYPLPPGLGCFPLQHVDDFKDRLPPHWLRHGGVFLPMYQAEALWIAFSGKYPCAVKIAAGKVNAVTGEPWTNTLTEDPQDYVVIPGQPWLDGFCVGRGLIRQFVAMPLGDGYTAEEQLTGEAVHGGLQLLVFPMKRERYEDMHRDSGYGPTAVCCQRVADRSEMGLAAGGLMRQGLYEDEHGLDAWDQTSGSRCFVHITNSLSYVAIAGAAPPQEPPTAHRYTQAGLPWFEYYADDKQALAGAAKLAGLDSLAAKHIKKGEGVLQGDAAIPTPQVVPLGVRHPVREGVF